MATLGAFIWGIKPVGATRVGCWGKLMGGCTGMFPGRLMEVALPVLLLSSLFLKVCDGGASAVKEMMFSPLMMTSPKVRLICFCTPVLFVLVILYSSASASTMFMCLSKARKVPTIMRPSWMVILTLKSIHCRNLLLCVAISIFYNRLAATSEINKYQEGRECSHYLVFLLLFVGRVLFRRLGLGRLGAILLFEEVVLHPEGKAVHYHRDYHYYNNKLEHFVLFYPSHR